MKYAVISFVLLFCNLAFPATLVNRWTMDDNAANSTITDSVGSVNGTLYFFPAGDEVGDFEFDAVQQNTSVQHITGLLNGAIDFTENDYCPTEIMYQTVVLPANFKAVFSADYTVTYLFKGSERCDGRLAGSVMASGGSNVAPNTLIDIATLYHAQSYWKDGVRHLIIVIENVPEAFDGQWCFYSHRVTQAESGVRVRIGINGLDYNDVTVADYNMADYAAAGNRFGSTFLASYNSWGGMAGETSVGVADEAFKCQLDDIRIYTGALSDADIQTLVESYGLTYDGASNELCNCNKRLME